MGSGREQYSRKSIPLFLSQPLSFLSVHPIIFINFPCFIQHMAPPNHPSSDSLTFTAPATVISVSAAPKDRHLLVEHLFVELDRPIFYPGGGGQPYDTGTLTSAWFSGEVISAVKKNTAIILEVIPSKSSKRALAAGDTITQNINKERRTALIRMHTGEHILFKALQSIVPDAALDKIDLDVNESQLMVRCAALDWPVLFKAEALANAIIQEDRPIMLKTLTKEEAATYPGLRIKLGRITEETVRVAEIKDFDLSACTGTHAPSTGFVRNLFISGYNILKGSYQIRFRTALDFTDLAPFLSAIREIQTILKKPVLETVASVASLLEERDALKSSLRELQVSAG
ncbi:hypothetical protein COY95_02730, partial [Candidatus Woesearchaeota archaeon CG_4_10_14_0_8_um_filter_47_5]